MIILEYFESNRKKVSKIVSLIKQAKHDEISFEEFRLKLSSFLSKLVKTQVPVVIINDKYPQIFINCHISGFRFRVDGIYISTSLFKEFTSGELTAAILHELGHFIRTKKKPELIRQFYLSRSIGYVYFGFLAMSTFVLRVLTKWNKTKRYLFLIAIILSTAAILGLLMTSYFYYKTGQEEYIADSFATKFGYGKELVSFIKRYKEIEDMYGHPSLPEIAKQISEGIRSLIKGLGLHPIEEDRICEICRDIINKTDKNVKFDVDLYKWAKDQYKLHCVGHKPVNKDDVMKAQMILSILKKKLKK